MTLSHSNSGERLLLAFYGDDVTGSTDALEAAALAGVRAVLFLSPPTAEQLRRHPGVRVVGVAGDSRSRTPDWMDAHLPQLFRRLKGLGAPIVHYKTCSTFDSSPSVGSIGRAIEIGLDCFRAPVPVVVGVTRHRRFVVFSNLFAAGSVAGADDIYRIDRHPTMSRHPVTPMDEADLRQHLKRQTSRSIASFHFAQMLADGAQAELDACPADIVIFDTFDAATTRRMGELLARLSQKDAIFVAGSSGVEYALFDYLHANGQLPEAAPFPPRGPVDKLAAVYGSCSPVSAQQISWAENNGFKVIMPDTAALVTAGPAAEAACAAEMAAALSHYRGVALTTARGPDDPRIAQTRQALERAGYCQRDGSQLLGEKLGRILRDVLENTGTPRAVLAGGDSSSHAISQMGVEALDVAGPLVPGAPLCRIYASNRRLDGTEIVLKGGQVGEPDFLGRLMAGH